MNKALKEYLLSCFAGLIVAFVVNLFAIAIEIVCDFSLLGLGGRTPSNSVLALFLHVSRTILWPMRWLGGYGFNHFVMMCLIEALVVAVLIYGYFFHLRSPRIVSSNTP